MLGFFLEDRGKHLDVGDTQQSKHVIPLSSTKKKVIKRWRELSMLFCSGLDSHLTLGSQPEIYLKSKGEGNL